MLSYIVLLKLKHTCMLRVNSNECVNHFYIVYGTGIDYSFLLKLYYNFKVYGIIIIKLIV